MPKSGTFIRTLIAVAAAAILAVVAAGTAGAAPAKASGTTLSGAGSSFVSPLSVSRIKESFPLFQAASEM